MKKLLLYTVLLCSGLVFAQKIAYVDTQYILTKMPQYQQAEGRLQEEVTRWKTEIEEKQTALNNKKIAFENEKILLTEEQIKTKTEEIAKADKELKALIEKKFGTNGESVAIRRNLVKPIQDQIWNTINGIAKKENYNMIFDKASDLTLIYSDPRFDLSDKVLKQLGMVSDEKKEEKSKTNTSKKSKK